jgi:hypothetical protein
MCLISWTLGSGSQQLDPDQHYKAGSESWIAGVWLTKLIVIDCSYHRSGNSSKERYFCCYCMVPVNKYLRKKPTAQIFFDNSVARHR